MKKPLLKALIFDVDGTLADTEMAHLGAFNSAFAELDLDWHWDVTLYKQLLSISGGKERIKHYMTLRNMRTIDGAALHDKINRIHEIKTLNYERAVSEGLVNMRPGVLSLLEAARNSGLKTAIATTTSPANVSALLGSTLGPHWRLYFDVIEDASTAEQKKPHPQVYLQTLYRLDLSGSECLVIEDSYNGLKAATAAGLPTIITPNSFTDDHDFSGALDVVPNLANVGLDELVNWHLQASMEKIARRA